MAVTAYLKLVGRKQGQIKGSVTQKGREDAILVHSYSHDIFMPRDQSAGLPAGKRQHKPFVIGKEADRATPALYSALSTNENFPTFLLHFWEARAGAASGIGVESQLFTIKLTNANIVSAHAFLPDNLDPASSRSLLREEWSFTYQRIEWTWTEGGIIASDDWAGA